MLQCNTWWKQNIPFTGGASLFGTSMDTFSSLTALFLNSVTLKRVIIKSELWDLEYIHVKRYCVRTIHRERQPSPCSSFTLLIYMARKSNRLGNKHCLTYRRILFSNLFKASKILNKFLGRSSSIYKRVQKDNETVATETIKQALDRNFSPINSVFIWILK